MLLCEMASSSVLGFKAKVLRRFCSTGTIRLPWQLRATISNQAAMLLGPLGLTQAVVRRPCTAKHWTYARYVSHSVLLLFLWWWWVVGYGCGQGLELHFHCGAVDLREMEFRVLVMKVSG